MHHTVELFADFIFVMNFFASYLFKLRRGVVAYFGFGKYGVGYFFFKIFICINRQKQIVKGGIRPRALAVPYGNAPERSQSLRYFKKLPC